MKLRVLLFCFVLSLPAAYAQKKKSYTPAPRKSSAQEKFLNKQFWLGFKAGVNLTDPVLQSGYSVIMPSNYDPASADKKYQSYNKIGGQATLELTFYFKGMSISAQPTYRTSRFVYSNEYQWTSPDDAAQRLNLKFEQDVKLDYADLPLLFKYEFTQNKLRPYLQAGVYYSILINANKGVTVSGTDEASGGTTNFKNEPVVVGAKDLFTNNWGIIAGAGLNYNLGNVRIVFDASYHGGMSNIADVKNRFSNDRLNGIGDAQDDLKTNHLVFSVGCLFPLRFLSSSFKSLD